MKHPVKEEVERETGSGTDLWLMIAPMIIWSLHFLFCYVWMAIVCEKAGDAGYPEARLWIGVATAVALGLILWITTRLWRVHNRSVTDNDFEFEHNTPEERHRFLSHVALMLCALAAVSVVYVALPALVLETCG